MTDIFLPLSVDVARITFRYLDSSGVSRNPYSGGVRTASRGGDRLGASLEFTPAGRSTTLGATKRRKLISTLMAQQGMQNRLVLTDPAYTCAGSFPGTEAITNNDFLNGTTGFTCNSEWTLSASEYVIRSRRNAVTLQGDALIATLSSSLSQYAPYVGRVFTSLGSGYTTASTFRLDDRNNSITGATLTGFGMKSQVIFTGSGGNIQLALVDLQASALFAGDYLMANWSSLSRCALADAGANALLTSDTPGTGTGWYLSNATAGANGTAAPDGTITAWALAETTTPAVAHHAGQGATFSSAVADFTFSLYVRPTNRTWCILQLVEATGGGVCNVYFNLSTGASGTTVTGSNWSDLRWTSTNAGSSWWKLTITARKTNAATSIHGRIYPATADNVSTYTGVTSPVALLTWRASLAQSSVPMKGAQTTSTALASGTAQSGGGINLKGLPVSTTGLLVVGDWVEIITSLGSQLSMVTAPLDSDAGGLGYLRVSPPVRGTVADNAAVIVNKPMGRFVLAGSVAEFLTDPGIISSASIDLEESPT